MNSIKKKSDFSYLREHGVRKRTQMLTLILSNNPKYGEVLSCVVAGKRTVGNAVKRNRAKRRVRELIRKHAKLLKSGDLLLVITTKAVCTATYSELEHDFLYTLRKAIFKENHDGSRY